MPIDARTAYETLTELELRLAGDRFEDFAEGIERATWPFLSNEHVVPRLLESGRISEDEAGRLERIRRRPRAPVEEDEDGVELYPDAYELLLTLYPVLGIDDQNAFRGHADHRWLLEPTLLREAPAPDELDERLERTFGFLRKLAAYDDEYQSRALDDDPAAFLELLAVAQHYGLPTHLLDFTSDMRTGTFFATPHPAAQGVGELIVMRSYEFDRYGGDERSPYGVRVTRSAPNRRIERQRGLFLYGFEPAIFHDPNTDFLSRHRFRHDGRPFPATGGYARDELLAEGELDPLAALAREAGAGPAAPRALERHFARYAAEARTAVAGMCGSVDEPTFARAAAWGVRMALPAGAPVIDRRVGKLFALIQTDLRSAEVPEFLKFHGRAQMATQAYLDAAGSLEERLAAAIGLVWARSCADPGQKAIVDGIVDRRVDEFAGELSAG